MIGLRSSTEEDKLQLAKCFSLDEWHKREQVEHWLASELTTFYDERGPILFMCFTMEGKTLRLHAQFDTKEKLRTAKAIPRVLEMIEHVARENGYNQLVFWSASPSLIAFMENRLGFYKSGEDYALDLEATNAALRPECRTNC